MPRSTNQRLPTVQLDPNSSDEERPPTPEAPRRSNASGARARASSPRPRTTSPRRRTQGRRSPPRQPSPPTASPPARPPSPARRPGRTPTAPRPPAGGARPRGESTDRSQPRQKQQDESLNYADVVVKELSSTVRTARAVVHNLLRQVPNGLIRHVTNMRLLVLATDSMLILQCVSALVQQGHQLHTVIGFREFIKKRPLLGLMLGRIATDAGTAFLAPSRWLEKRHLLCGATWNQDEFLDKMLNQDEVLRVSEILQPIEDYANAPIPEVLRKLAVTEDMLRTNLAYRGQGDRGIRDSEIFRAAAAERSVKKKRKSTEQPKPAIKKTRQPRPAHKKAA